MASTATIEDLAQQLTEVSNKFVDSFVESMTQEDEINKFLRGRQEMVCWYKRRSSFNWFYATTRKE